MKPTAVNDDPAGNANQYAKVELGKNAEGKVQALDAWMGAYVEVS